MTPSPFQRLFTDDRPFYFLLGVGAIGVSTWAGSILINTLSLSLWSICKFIFLMIVAICLGSVSGVFFGAIFLLFLVKWIAKRNGAPFQAGDEVVILSKRFPGRVTKIYEVWAERYQVRVELGDVERRDVTDVFSYTDICRRSGH